MFEVIDETAIRVTVEKWTRLNKFNMPLEILASEPIAIKHFEKKLLVASIVLGVFSSSFATRMFSTSEDIKKGALGCLILFGGTSIFLFFRFLMRSGSATIFQNRFSGQPALVIWRDNPNKEDFERFTQTLSAKIKPLASGQRSTANLDLAEQLRDLKKMQDQGILTAEEFEKTKQKLLSSFGENHKIGF